MEEGGGGSRLQAAWRVLGYMRDEIANDAGVMGLEAAVGAGGVVTLGLVEAPLAAPGASAARYALWTALPSFAPGVAASTLAQQTLPEVEPEAARGLLRLRNVQAARQMLALATLLGVSVQAVTAAARGQERYWKQVAEGREPPLSAPAAIRVSDRPPSPSAAFHVAVGLGPEDAVAPWVAGAGAEAPRRWWTRPGWIADPREWRPLVQGARDRRVFLEADVSSSEQRKGLSGGGGGLSLELALEGLRAGGRAAELASSSAVRVLLGGGDAVKAGSSARRAVEESGSVDLLLDGEAAVAMAVLAWVQNTPYARAWAALAAQQAREEQARLSAREGNPVWQGYERASELLEAALDAPYVGQPLHWLYRSLEGLGRRVRWLVKGGVTARDALEEYKVVVLVHDADGPRLPQRLQLKAALQAAGWDVWGPSTSTSRLVQDREALVPVVVYCQDDATTLDRARFLVRAGRPPELTCALLEDPEASCPWLSNGSSSSSSSDPHRPTVLSAADVHDALFAFVRRRVREGAALAEIQSELDASTRVSPRGEGGMGKGKKRKGTRVALQPVGAAGVAPVVVVADAAKE